LRINNLQFSKGDDDISGQIEVKIKGKKLEHLGIRVELVGYIGKELSF